MDEAERRRVRARVVFAMTRNGAALRSSSQANFMRRARAAVSDNWTNALAGNSKNAARSQRKSPVGPSAARRSVICNDLVKIYGTSTS